MWEIKNGIGEKIELFIHTHVREDQITLFGFETKEMLSVFKLLISVKGIGPKVAQKILLNLKAEEIYLAIANEDADLLCTVPGIGKKGAQRLILEMRNKIKDSFVSLAQDSKGSKYDNMQDAMQALISLGFESRQAREMIKKTNLTKSAPVENIIKMALSQK